MKYTNAIRRFNENHMYKDSASIFRYQNTKNPDGSTTQKLRNVPELSGIPCLINIEKTDNAEAGMDLNPVNLVYTLFISDLIGIKSGDYIQIMRHGRGYKFIAGEPVVYEFHQEVPMHMKEWS